MPKGSSRGSAREALWMLAGAGLGAAVMYVLDPERGADRRARVREKGESMLRNREAIAGRATDLRNRARGFVAEAVGRVRHEEIDDERLVARVRAALGHHTSHASAIDVSAQDGVVTLRGTLPAEKLEEVVAGVRRVRGVRRVESRLEVPEVAGQHAGGDGAASG